MKEQIVFILYVIQIWDKNKYPMKQSYNDRFFQFVPYSSIKQVYNDLDSPIFILISKSTTLRVGLSHIPFVLFP